MNRKRAGSTVLAFGMLMLGVYIILLSIGLPIIRLRYLWPLMGVWVGLSLIVQFAADQEKRGGLIFFGVLITLYALLAFPFSIRLLSLSGETVALLWPLLPLGLGMAFMALYIGTDLSDQTVLVVSTIVGGVGLLALPITLGTVRSQAFAQTLRYWPLLVLFILVGIIFGPRLTTSTDT